MKEFKLSVLLPCYQEEENLRVLIPRLTKVLEPYNYEILIIDTNNILDGTKKFCDQQSNEKVLYINREPENYYGDAVRTGIKYSTGNYIIFMDADGSHSPEFISTMLEQKDEFDLIIASRYVEGGYTENNKILVLMSRVVNILYRFVIGIQCNDVSNSFRLYHADQLKKLSFNCKNFDIVEEILFKLVRNNNGFKLKEIPYSFKQRLFGSTKRNMLVFIYSYLKTLVKFFIQDKISRFRK